MVTRITRAKISFVSLCKRGANKIGCLYKSDASGDDLQLEVLAKMDEEGVLTSLVYAPETPDAGEMVANKQAIRDMAFSFAETGFKLDTEHDRRELTKDQAFVVENFIVQPGDPRFADAVTKDGKPINTDGAWALSIKLLDPDLRKRYREGQWDGVSLFSYKGDFELSKSSSDSRAAAAADNFLDSKAKATTMDETVLQELLKSTVAEPIAALVARVDALEKAAEGDDTEDNAEPEIDVTDPEQLDKAIRDAQIAELQKTHDLKTTAGLIAFREALAKLDDTQEEEGEQETQPAPRRAPAQGNNLGKSRQTQEAPAGDSVYGDTFDLTKSELDAIDASLAAVGVSVKKEG